MIWDKDDDEGETMNPPGATYDMNLQVVDGAYDNLEINNSLTNHYKKVLNVRNKYPIIHSGLYNYHKVSTNKIALFSVTESDETIYIAHNFSSEAITFELPVADLTILEKINTVGTPPHLDGQSLTLSEYSSVILQ
jgi:glycosidase